MAPSMSRAPRGALWWANRRPEGWSRLLPFRAGAVRVEMGRAASVRVRPLLRCRRARCGPRGPRGFQSCERAVRTASDGPRCCCGRFWGWVESRGRARRICWTSDIIRGGFRALNGAIMRGMRGKRGSRVGEFCHAYRGSRGRQGYEARRARRMNPRLSTPYQNVRR